MAPPPPAGPRQGPRQGPLSASAVASSAGFALSCAISSLFILGVGLRSLLPPSASTWTALEELQACLDDAAAGNQSESATCRERKGVLGHSAELSWSSEKAHLVPITVLDGDSDEGVCLDGSPPAYHLSPGWGSGALKWLVFLEGGAWCVDADDCRKRSKTRLGSSKKMTWTVPFGGILSNSSRVNPLFHNWNAVFVRYCDGSSFTGRPSDDGSAAKTAGVHVDGQRVFERVVRQLLFTKGMRHATHALLAGCSAGGLAALLHCDRFKELVVSHWQEPPQAAAHQQPSKLDADRDVEFVSRRSLKDSRAEDEEDELGSETEREAGAARQVSGQRVGARDSLHLDTTTDAASEDGKYTAEQTEDSQLEGAKGGSRGSETVDMGTAGEDSMTMGDGAGRLQSTGPLKTQVKLDDDESQASPDEKESSEKTGDSELGDSSAKQPIHGDGEVAGVEEEDSNPEDESTEAGNVHGRGASSRGPGSPEQDGMGRSQGPVVKCLSDAGFFPDVEDVEGKHTLRHKFSQVVGFHNPELSPRCLQAEGDAKDRTVCFFVESFLPHVEAPVFLLNALYDLWMIRHAYLPRGVSGDWGPCQKDLRRCSEQQLLRLHAYRADTLQLVERLVGSLKSPSSGGFLDSCRTHCQSQSSLRWNGPGAPIVGNRTMADAVAKWFLEEEVGKVVSDCEYPCNPSCYPNALGY